MSDQASEIQIVGGDREETDPKKLLDKLPTIKLHWDDKTHDVAVNFESADFRSFSFVIHVLERATELMKQMWAQQQQQAMTQGMIEQAQAAQLAQNLKLGPSMNPRRNGR